VARIARARSVVIDPGVMTQEPGAVAGVEAVLVTHEHFDHFEADRLLTAVADDARLVVYTCPGVARHLGQLGDRVINGEVSTPATH